MNWFYALEGQKYGPFDETAFEQLSKDGVITAETLVWHEGMPDWQPYSQITGTSAMPATTAAVASGVACSECGRSYSPADLIKLGERYVCAVCKPIALQKMREGVGNAGAEAVRQVHISHEASIKSVGILYFVGAALFVIAGLGSVASPEAKSVGLGLFFVCLGAGQIATGIGLRRLAPWSRIVAGVLSGIGLLGIPIGTIINGYILYLLFSKKGAMVFSAEYKQIIEQTPHVKYRTSIVVWILLCLLLALFGVAMLAFFFGSQKH